jgi:L-asparaginase
MKRLSLIFTGGTISMLDTPDGAVPALRGDDLLEYVPQLADFCAPKVLDFGQLPGPHMTPARMLELRAAVQAELDAGADGVVVTHGTDTLEESAYLLELLHTDPRPVVFVGAMRTSSQLSWDGPINLYNGCRVAADERMRSRGVLVTMNSTVFAAGEVTKTYTDALDTFQSPDFGPVGAFDGDELRVYRSPPRRTLSRTQLETRVSLHVVGAGDDGTLIDHCVERGDRGVVIEALGRGNLPPAAAAAARRAVQAGVLVLLTSRCWGGRVAGAYGYEGGGARLLDAGLVFTPGLPGHKARILAMLALGAGMDAEELRRWLAT